MSQHEPRVQSVKRGKISFGRNISQNQIFEMVEREREREREREKEREREEGIHVSFDDFSGFVGRKSLCPELKFFVLTWATRRHQKGGIS